MNTTTGDVICGECGAPMMLRASRYGPFWGCTRYPDCDGTHGAHPDGSPKGVPANRATRDARIRAHAAFDPIWKTAEMRRNEAYAWLARQPGIPRAECHIGSFTIERCEAVIRVMAERVDGRS